MDKLATRLRDDAQAINVEVSPELDARSAASLKGVTPEVPIRRALPPSRQPWFWWASSLTGVAAALAVVVL